MDVKEIAAKVAKEQNTEAYDKADILRRVEFQMARFDAKDFVYHVAGLSSTNAGETLKELIVKAQVIKRLYDKGDADGR